MATAVVLLNRHPSTSINNDIPYHRLYHKMPDYSILRVFGCLCYPNLSATTSHKLAPRSSACVFIGYPSSQKGYRCLDLSTRRVIISRHVVFDEANFPFAVTKPPPESLDFLVQGRPPLLPRQLRPRTLSERGSPSISRTWPTWTLPLFGMAPSATPHWRPPALHWCLQSLRRPLPQSALQPTTSRPLRSYSGRLPVLTDLSASMSGNYDLRSTSRALCGRPLFSTGRRRLLLRYLAPSPPLGRCGSPCRVRRHRPVR